ncbi:dnaJ domain containing protein isoform X3 [Zea mays]|uniref:dnaJ domain containing protein isoform X3 n=1 Tax=Zea mays TaxID=4577 RepID=UPI001652441F|nr:dnaJ domain containing protein isoform X3 [Zea mays]
MIAVASSFPSRAHAAPFGSGTLPPPSTRRSTSLRHPRVSALGGGLEGEPGKILDPRATPFQILGLDAAAGYSAAELKAAFRARVKEFHPDVCKDPENADLIMRRVIEAYQMLSGNQEMMFERNNVDPFDEPECEARDIFVNELLCIGTDDTGTARAISQGNGEDDLVQLAVGQCPRKCIYYVTPCQRTILEDVLASSSGFPPFKSEVRE